MVNAESCPRCVLVTGAHGFVGSHIVDALLKNGYSVKAVVRNAWSNAPKGVEVLIADLSKSVNWNNALCGVTTIIHLAARVHQKNQPHMALEEFRNINTRATLELAEQASNVGVKQFIYLSTIAVNGTFTEPGEKFTEQSESRPKGSYAISKYEAELGLKRLAEQRPMALTIIRPPMVYGKNAPGNFSRLISLIKTRIPLPFGSVVNLRSFIFIENLTDFIMLCVEHPDARNELFLVSDNDDRSLKTMIFQISNILELRVGVFPFPVSWLEWALRLIRRSDMVNQLLKPMQIDITKAHVLLGWTAPYGVSDGLTISIKNKNNIGVS